MSNNRDNKNYSGKNLAGRSFKGMDLSGADFSDCDLRGVDFTGANLTGAKFCGARMGRRLRVNVLTLLLQFVLGVVAGYVIFVALLLFGEMLHPLFSISRNEGILVAGCIWIGLLSINTWWAWRTQSLLSYRKGLTVVMGIASFAASRSNMVANAADAGFILLALIAAAIAAQILVFGLTAILVEAAATASAFSLLGFVSALLVNVGSTQGNSLSTVAITTVVIVSIITLLITFHLTYRAINTEIAWLSGLRSFALKPSSLFTTQFAHANLTDADFSNANVCQARFNLVQSFQGSVWNKAQNLHLAITDKTLLAPRKVRDLLTQRGEYSEQDFSKLDLHGLKFTGLNLQSISFYMADLNHADLTNCNLSNTNLSACQLFGAKLDGCQLTGAIIENWNIDKHTSLAEIECDFVWLKADQSERQPPAPTNFKPSEFSKLYQEIAGTVDFIAHNPAELAALLVAVDTVKSQRGEEDIYIQSIERKQDSVVIKVNKPIDIEAQTLHQQVLQEKESIIKTLQLENKDLIQKLFDEKDKNQDLLAQLLRETIAAKQVNITQQIGDHNMHDQSRKTGDIHAPNGVVNLGDHNTITVQHLPADNTLKPLLEQLQTLIQASSVPEGYKKLLLEESNKLAHASQQQTAEGKNVAQKTLQVFKDFVEGLKDVPETAKTFGETLAQIAIVLGVSNMF